MLGSTPMDEYIQRTPSPFSKFHYQLSHYRAITSVAILIWLNVIFVGPIAEAVELPTVDEVMKELKVSDSDKEKVRQGEIVDWSPTEGSDRELALGMVFLVEATPEDIAPIYRQAMVLKEVSVITAHGTITGEGTMEQVAEVTLKPNAEKEAKRYLNAEPGDELNLDAKEMAAFRALKSAGKDGGVPVSQVEALIRQ